MTVRPLVTAGLLLGLGLGGFLDGIVFHQLLQVHGMLSARIPKTTVVDVEINMFWDGVFHVAAWSLTVAGVVALFRAARRPGVLWSTRVFAGALACGWGVFNLVEGVIDHHLLHLHHVVERRGPSMWDWAFLASGVALIGWGAAQVRSAAARPAMRPAPAATRR